MRGEVQFRSDKLAVLIDADNTSATVAESLLKEIAKLGTAYIKRVYGDWTSPQMSSWKKIINEFAIVPVQQFGYTAGKNSTDSALIIDAMDLLYTNTLDAFCIVSSDSDFTRLAHRIRQNGVSVYGFGKRQTPKAFIAACDRFIYTELIDTSDNNSKIGIQSEHQDKSPFKTEKNNQLNNILIEAYDDVVRDDGLANLGTLGQQLLRLNPAFDARDYGYKKLGELLKSSDLFEVKGNDVKRK